MSKVKICPVCDKKHSRGGSSRACSQEHAKMQENRNYKKRKRLLRGETESQNEKRD